MRYSNAGEIIAIMVIWAVILLVARNVLEAPAEVATQAVFPKPQVVMSLRHVGCTNQDQQLVQALRAIPWLEPAQVQRMRRSEAAHNPQHAGPAPHSMTPGEADLSKDSCTVQIVAGVKDVDKVDFVELHRTVRNLGVVPSTMLFGGVPNFAIQAQMTGMSMGCLPCVQTALDSLKPLPVSAAYYYSTTPDPQEVSKHSTFEWVENKRVDEKQNTITLAVRPMGTARVAEFIRALERNGLLPTAIRVVASKA